MNRAPGLVTAWPEGLETRPELVVEALCGSLEMDEMLEPRESVRVPLPEPPAALVAHFRYRDQCYQVP